MKLKRFELNIGMQVVLNDLPDAQVYKIVEISALTNTVTLQWGSGARTSQCQYDIDGHMQLPTIGQLCA
jgi:hypothetical protein